MAAEEASSVRASSTQLWAVGSDGAVYVLQEVGAWLSSMRSNEVLHKSVSTVHDNWAAVETEGGGRFDRVVCGAEGLVCAKRDKILYVRRGVTYDNPAGTAWAKALCDAQEFAVGRKCLVRRTTQDRLFVTEPLDLSSTSSIFLPHWNGIPTCDDVNTHQLFVLDSHDNLFLLSPSSGEVYVCQSLSSGSPDDFKWIKLTGGPPMIKKPSTFLSMLSWGAGSNSNTSVFSSVSAGDSCVWCVSSSGQELFQLVLKYVKKRRRKRRREGGEGDSELVNIEGSWKKFELPGKDEVTLLAGDWTELDTMCAVVRENRTVISYAVLQENLGRIEIPNPEGARHRWKSISICAVPKPRLFDISGSEISLASSPKKVYSSIYPKLPPHEDYDLCCEDGQCSFCLQASREDAVNGSRMSLGESSFSSLGSEEGRLEGEMVTGVSFASLGERGPGSPVTKRGKVQVATALSDKEEEETSFSTGRKRRRKYFSASNISYTKRSKLFTSDPPQLSDIPFKLAPSLQNDKAHSLLQHQVIIITV